MRRTLFLLAALAALMPIAAMAQGATGGENTPVDRLSDFALWGIIGGFVTSIATAAINRQRWKSVTKLGVFLALCCVTAGLDAYFKRELDFHHWSRALLIVLASGITTYAAAKPAIKQIEAETG